MDWFSLLLIAVMSYGGAIGLFLWLTAKQRKSTRRSK